jgi:CheY-like chemotaxis protein
VFERFRQADASTTRNYRGLGLGLSIVKHIVELHGGTVSVNSAGEGQGATFVVQLPVAVVRPLMRGVHPRLGQRVSLLPADADLSNIVVLVVDDEDDGRKLLSRLLSDRGATVVTAASAAEGLAAIEQHPPDVLISDIGMPEVDGYELVRRIRGRFAETGRRFPMIALTAFARSEDRTRALLAGFATHIAKPVDAAELIATIAAVTGRIA